jgi:TatD DNase family protein
MIVFSDSHIHLAVIQQASAREASGGTCSAPAELCAASHSIEEFILSEQLAARQPSLYLSFGIHPQNPDAGLIPFLETLLHEHRIHAVGEAGFDLFTAAYKADTARQEKAWKAQVDLAAAYKKPLVIHCRKALHLVFRDSGLLAKLPACVFHSFAGSPLEAQSFLRRGVNAYFSFGKPLLNNNKRAIACVQELPVERLLAETDAPYQRLKDEQETSPRDIIRVHEAIASIKGIRIEAAAEAITSNFHAVFGQTP